MKIIRTILGDIPAESIGVTDSHDHLIRSGGPEVAADRGFLMDDVEAATKEFVRFLNAGGTTMICMDPIGCGRNVGKMLEVAGRLRGQGNLVMTTGFHKSAHYCPNTSFLATVDETRIAEMMALEITEGMDKHSYNGPVVERTGARAGLIKAGASNRLITKLEAKSLRIAAAVQRGTGCAVSVHTDNGTMAPEILGILRQSGAKLEKVVLCHMQRNPDRVYYRRVLDLGTNICFDEPNKPHYRPDSQIAENIAYLVARGYEKQIVLGMDGGRIEATASYMEPYGQANGLEYLLTRFVPLLREVGLSEAQVATMLKDNPAELFSIDI